MESIIQFYFDLINNYQAIVAAIIGVLSAIFVSLFQYFTTTLIKNKEKRDFENAVVSAIYEELSCLYKNYTSDFDDAFLGTEDGEYIKTTFTITQDFFTIYHNNAENIGLIKVSEIRNSIVGIYILLKKFIENILYYNSQYNTFQKRRISLVCTVYNTPNEIAYEGIDFHDDYIATIISNLQNPDGFVNNLIYSDSLTRKALIKQTYSLKADYLTIKNEIEKVKTLIKKNYKLTMKT